MAKDQYLVIGGSGFLGRHIVDQLRVRGDSVSIFDIVQRYHDVPFFSGDITDESAIASALKQSGTTCIIHTASPPAGLTDGSIYMKVNVDGTRAVIDAAIACGVRKLVFTSSAGVIFNGTDIIDVDERLPYPDHEALVIASNGKGGLLTVALRPAGIFGPGDRQCMSGLYQVYENNQTHFQIGDNTNMMDWTYVGNVAKAHLLAADKLDLPPPAPPLSTLGKAPLSVEEVPPLSEAEKALVNTPLSTVDVTTGHFKIPTSNARPLGPYVTRPENGDELEANWEQGSAESSGRPVGRTRFDQLSEAGIARSKLHDPEQNPLQVAGQIFFITNGEPTYFWDMPRAVYQQLDQHFPGHRKPRSTIKMPKAIGLAAATGSEVSFSCASKWHNIEKARRILGYEPDVGIQEGVEKMVEWWWSEYQAGNHKQAH
ncbi:C-3 sterol dehydrogenase [Ephemerocybe angulata]|uniref:C-3 sterol dehydrogenase n=1 Tax=Ephemerocybe angulata TaxID=980116 RepID=A0A8H6I226_9AGAR|nr:C-3 sterol dehydrogenase [Tulosesus angulatus]